MNSGGRGVLTTVVLSVKFSLRVSLMTIRTIVNINNDEEDTDSIESSFTPSSTNHSSSTFPLALILRKPIRPSSLSSAISYLNLVPSSITHHPSSTNHPSSIIYHPSSTQESCYWSMNGKGILGCLNLFLRWLLLLITDTVVVGVVDGHVIYKVWMMDDG